MRELSLPTGWRWLTIGEKASTGDYLCNPGSDDDLQIRGKGWPMTATSLPVRREESPAQGTWRDIPIDTRNCHLAIAACGELAEINAELLAALEEIVDYRGGAESALHDEYVMERVAAAIANAKRRP